jgi:hypothetical protein
LGERIPVKEELLLIHFLDHLESSGGDRRSSRLPTSTSFKRKPRTSASPPIPDISLRLGDQTGWR